LYHPNSIPCPSFLFICTISPTCSMPAHF
jgi:hypothetical protein